MAQVQVQEKSAKGGKVRSAKYESKRQEANILLKQGLTQNQIASRLEVSVRTIRSWKKNDDS